MLVAEGAADGAIDAVGVSLWDLAAVQVIVEEAGGTFTDFGGVRRADGGSAISSNGRLHDALLAPSRICRPAMARFHDRYAARAADEQLEELLGWSERGGTRLAGGW